ncbi:MAG: glycosyltransferase family 2 protein [Bacteroidales bacterium]|nr:glycosyltransferase family 2 protein [Bacteroidales bacterium]
MSDTILYIVIPCYNEQEVLNLTADVLKQKMNTLFNDGKISTRSKVMFVNDGSKDKTWQIIKDLHREDALFTGITLSRNRGHQNALLAGLMTAKQYADIVISMDADMQDDINVIDRFIDKYNQGNDIVYGVRSSRKTDTVFKRNTALAFYKLMQWLGAETVYNHADYRLMSKRALEGLAQFNEVNLFLRGLVPMVGYLSDTVEYERGERKAGESKYPLKKMTAFALDGITSLSIKPITLITKLGLIIFLLSLAALIWILIVKFTGHATIGWSSILISIWMLGGLQLLAIGIIGEYIGKIYKETKQRPRYIIAENLEEVKDTNQ